MIVAAILRNYKCYKGINFISFVPSLPYNMNMIIGDNGAGKSSILEAMDSFFNDASWTINTAVNNKDDVSVGVVLWIKKEQIDISLSLAERDLLATVSEAYWNLDMSINSSFGKYYQGFFSLREKLIHTRGKYYFFVVGKQYTKKEYNSLSFEQYIKNYLNSLDYKVSAISKLYQKIISTYSYLYVPVETSVSEFLRLETRGMQTLMDKNIKDDISSKLNEKSISQKKSKNRTKKLSLLDIINMLLEEFIDNVQSDIQKINPDYNFRPQYKQFVKLTANHVADTIIESYYKKRTLKKGDKPITSLSSGEKRIALIDIIYVFLSKNSSHDKELIVAVDEPENSLHISKCYSQFNRLNEMALNFNKQIFLTTHWYGALPIINKGTLLHLGKPGISGSYDLSNYFECRRELPNDIMLKGYFDLASSILSAYRNNQTSWLLVEGKEDKRYIEYYIDVKSLNIIVMPLGGCANVKKVYEYLYVPMSSAKEGFDNLNERILCIVDTDELCVDLNVESSTKNQSLVIRRINENPSHAIDFKSINDPNRNPTEIEDILDGTQFYTALEQLVVESDDSVVKEAFNAFELDKSVVGSRIKGDYSILNHKGLGRSIRGDKEIIIDFINNNKEQLSERYTSLPKSAHIPEWVSWITNFFTKH